MTDDERAARVRAALAFRFASSGAAKASIPDQAKALGWDHAKQNRRYYRLVEGDETLFLELLDRLVLVTGVPAWFFAHGFAPPGQSELRDEMHDLRTIVLGLATNVVQLTQELQELRGTGRPAAE